MRQSITTRFIAPTNTRGSRAGATSSAGLRKQIAWDDELNEDENHRAAAVTMIREQGWGNAVWVAGYGKDGERVWVATDSRQVIAEVSA